MAGFHSVLLGSDLPFCIEVGSPVRMQHPVATRAQPILPVRWAWATSIRVMPAPTHESVVSATGIDVR
jgi:hypothetical protein